MARYRFVAEDYGSPMIHVCNYYSASTGLMQPIIGANDAASFFVFRKGKWKMAVDADDWGEQGRRALKLLENRAFFEKTCYEERKACMEVDAIAGRLRSRDFADSTSVQLAQEYRRLYDAWQEMNVWGHVINLADFEHFMLTDRMLAFLEKRRQESGAAESTAELFSVITTSLERSPIQQHEADFFRLLKAVQGDYGLASLFRKEEKQIIGGLAAFPSFSKMLDEHVLKYDWMQYHYDGPETLGEEYFIALLKSELRQGVNAAEKLAEIERKDAELAERQDSLEKKLGLGEEERHWMRLARAFMFLKGLRKDTVFKASRNSEGLLKEIGRRLGLPLQLVRYLSLEEAETLLVEGKKAVAGELGERFEYSVYGYEGGKVSVFTGKQADARASLVREETAAGVSELKGTPARAGLVKGTVKIIARAEDMHKMNRGDVLVSPATNPNLVPAMKKAAAIVTDEGGITCHAAIVSRELGIPCVVGTRIATKALKDGDLVEVDATNGVVKKITA